MNKYNNHINSVTTMLEEVIFPAKATGRLSPYGQRYSLNFQVTERGKSKELTRLLHFSKSKSNRMKLAVTQALDRRSGAVFYLDVKYGTTKGGITTGGTMMSATTGHNSTLAGREFASVRVTTESISSGSNITNGTLTYTPVVLGSVVITNGTETLSDINTPGILVSSLSSGHSGVVYANGSWSVTGWTGSGATTATYKYDWQTFDGTTTDTESVPEVNISVTSSTITAEDFPLRAYFTLGAAIDLEKAHGLKIMGHNYSNIIRNKLFNSVNNSYLYN